MPLKKKIENMWCNFEGLTLGDQPKVIDSISDLVTVCI